MVGGGKTLARKTSGSRSADTSNLQQLEKVSTARKTTIQERKGAKHKGRARCIDIEIASGSPQKFTKYPITEESQAIGKYADARYKRGRRRFEESMGASNISKENRERQVVDDEN